MAKSKGHPNKRSVTSLAAELRDRFDLTDAAADVMEFQELDSGDDEDEFVETIITTSRKRVSESCFLLRILRVSKA